ncbi:crosslink repair DNA glycosylase YcaQ family protein [Hydrogenophaga sp.]|uniref:winged helix DNA-binding domain-containing protein n=1 Tax=Hydrogenophaga sp. TaxID=1904254 RepID=UPI0025BAEB11|nr:crosslink repair DNA glycosylase YcaQ family protein [Hydrogenophaga sp.]
MAGVPTLDDFRRYAITRSLFKPTTLPAAIRQLGFVQADPMRAPARAQDLILRLRVKGYRAGDLERRYPQLDVDEDYFVNYGFLPRQTLALLHPREPRQSWDASTRIRAAELLAFVREHGACHPKQVQAEFADHGRAVSAWGSSLQATTHLLDDMHYRGLLRVQRREAGTRVFEAVEHPAQDDSSAPKRERAQGLLDRVVALYAPLPAASLAYLSRLLAYGAPHLKTQVREALKLAESRYGHAKVEGQSWFWPADENPRSRRFAPDDRLRLLAPFDPVVWDRRRFESLWGWAYRFEAYVPAPKRTMGHYALPVLWGEQMLGWANLRVEGQRLQHELGFVGARPKGAAFKSALDEALGEFEDFLAQGGIDRANS